MPKSALAFVLALVVGVLSALLVWCMCMFVAGEAYSFMLTGPWPNNAEGTRVLMLLAFLIGFIITFMEA